MNKIIRIGTRESALALWQAENVSNQLKEKGYSTKIVKIKSKGDIVLDKPLYELGITGIFTKTLDIALLNNDIDIAVHSMKDVPTLLPKGLDQFAVPKRGDHRDILVFKGDLESFKSATNRTIATGSLRRRAQWKNRYPSDELTELRGNVNSRLEKLANNDWDGAIFAKAGLSRINVLPETHLNLDWMIPAPAQGALMIAGRSEDKWLVDICAMLNDSSTSMAVQIERDFMRELEGGCTAPIGARAFIEKGKVHFVGVLLNLDGSERLHVKKEVSMDKLDGLGANCAREILNNGGDSIMKEIEATLRK
jgi:hydroxymethylbilane synthase